MDESSLFFSIIAAKQYDNIDVNQICLTACLPDSISAREPDTDQGFTTGG